MEYEGIGRDRAGWAVIWPVRSMPAIAKRSEIIIFYCRISGVCFC